MSSATVNTRGECVGQPGDSLTTWRYATTRQGRLPVRSRLPGAWVALIAILGEPMAGATEVAEALRTSRLNPRRIVVARKSGAAMGGWLRRTASSRWHARPPRSGSS
jgi:hypothetical protein